MQNTGEIANNIGSDLERQKELYVATIAHDLKNPLNAQISALEQIYKEKFGGITAFQKEILGNIIESSKFMCEMLSSLLISYKFDNGAVKLCKTPVNINDLISTSIKDILPMADEKSVFIEYINLSENSNALCDKNHIRRVISNMLTNMVQYSYKNTKAFVILEDEEKNHIIRFKSCGYPIDEQIKQHVFEKYVSGINKKAGTGIGLYFCKQVLEAHNGSVTLISKNSDIEFLIKIPKVQQKESVLKFV